MAKPPTRARSTDPRTDEELAAAARGGDAGAVAALLSRYERPVFRFGSRFCRDTEATREVLQETLLAAARALPSYRGESAVATWLFAIARRACVRLKQRRARATTTSLDEMLGEEDCARREAGEMPCDLPDPAAQPDEILLDREVVAALAQAFDALAPAYREILVLREVEELSAPAAALRLGISVDAVKSRLHRARVMVRERIVPVLEEGGPAGVGGRPARRWTSR